MIEVSPARRGDTRKKRGSKATKMLGDLLYYVPGEETKMTLQQAFDAARAQYPQPVDDRELLDSSGFWQRWSLVDAAAESGDPSRRGQLVLHEVRFTRCYEHDNAEDDRYEAERHPRNHWGFTVPATEFVQDREAARSRAWVEYAGSTPVWEVG